MRRVALIGANGQLGSEVVRCWPQSSLGRAGAELLPLTHADIEVRSDESVRAALLPLRPDCVVNTAAFHRVDDCERVPEEAFAVNAAGARHLAATCRELGAVLVHVSTDHVFGAGPPPPDGGYDEAAPPAPVNMYGVTKLAGEQVIRYLLPEDGDPGHMIVRTSGLFGTAGASGKGGNFVETMRRLALEGRAIRVVDDQVLSPSYAHDVAATLLEVLHRGGRGTFHITNAGACSWFDFARAIFRQAGLAPSLSPVSTAEYGAPAPRPACSVLANARVVEFGVAQPEPWPRALARYLAAAGAAAPVA